MSELNTDNLNLPQHLFLSSMLSSLSHAIFFCMIFMLSSSSLLDFNNKVIVNPDMEYIKVDLIPDFIITKNTVALNDDEIIPTSDKPPIKMEITKDDATETIKTSDKSAALETTKSVQSSEAQKVKLQSYEQTLAKHFIDAMPPIPENLSIKSNIQVLLKIDKSGKIVKYSFKGLRHNKELEILLTNTIAKANPAPTPPKDRFTAEYAQYIIPVFIR